MNQKYQGKNEKSVGKLVSDLKAALPSFEEFFKSLKKELKTLQKKAIIQNDTKLVNITEHFIKYIDQEIKKWKKVSQAGAFVALRQRMKRH
ncbi:MAG TPA: hypothetical protein ENI08_01470 [Candidatus Dependentiae bacterium]|nr:hypothetical protein [Candidatus Dependentiae bacterium]